MANIKACRIPELGDYFVYFGADFVEKSLQEALEAEAKKSCEQRDFSAQILLLLGLLGCRLAKIEINSDLCVPIENTHNTS